MSTHTTPSYTLHTHRQSADPKVQSLLSGSRSIYDCKKGQWIEIPFYPQSVLGTVKRWHPQRTSNRAGAYLGNDPIDFSCQGKTHTHTPFWCLKGSHCGPVWFVFTAIGNAQLIPVFEAKQEEAVHSKEAPSFC